jgi:hypothetical protein
VCYVYLLVMTVFGAGNGGQETSTGAAEARTGEPDATVPRAKDRVVDLKRMRPATSTLGDGIITRGKLNASLGVGESKSVNIKSEPLEPMDYTDDYGTDDVFFVGGTGQFALTDEEDAVDGSVSDDILDSSMDDPEGEGGSGSAKKSVSSVKPGAGTKRDADGSAHYDLGQSYRTIRAARRAASCQKRLNPNPVQSHTESVNTGTFCTVGDDCIRLTNIIHDLRNRSTKTLSLDPQSGTCSSCLAGRHAAWSSRTGGPIVLVVSDQNFPACLPARSAGKEFLRIIRCEDGSLQELTHALADTLGKIKLPKGSIMLLGSLSHLSNAGTEHYLVDWVRSRWWIRERLGEDLSVLPLAPIWSERLSGRGQIRSMVESLTWFSTLRATEAVLMKDICTHMLDRHLTCTTGLGWNPGRLCFRLPAGLDTRAVTATVSEGWSSLPESAPPLSMAAEKEVISSLVVMLNDAFEANLDLDSCLARSMADINKQRESDTAAKLVAVIGCSHAAKIAHALDLQGANVCDLSERGWKLSADNVHVLAQKLTDMENVPDLITIQVIDNNFFL